MSSTDNATRFCWEQALKTDRLFRVSHSFADAGQRPGLLALYALLSALEQIHTGSPDPDVARSRLAWWHHECQTEAASTSNHPVLREMRRAGTDSVLGDPAFSELFSASEMRLEALPPRGLAELNRICERIAKPQIELELKLAGCSIPNEEYRRLAGRRGLLQLLRESSVDADDRFWWLPLDLLARYAIGRSDICDDSAGDAAIALFEKVLEGGKPVTTGNSADISEITGLSRHLAVIAGLHERKLARMRGLLPSEFGRELAKVGFGDLFHAWGTARRFSRRR